MQFNAQQVFGIVDRVASRLGPINTFVERLADRVLPQATAKACHGGGAYLSSSCTGYCCWCKSVGDCYVGKKERVYYRCGTSAPCYCDNCASYCANTAVQKC